MQNSEEYKRFLELFRKEFGFKKDEAEDALINLVGEVISNTEKETKVKALNVKALDAAQRLEALIQRKRDQIAYFCKQEFPALDAIQYVIKFKGLVFYEDEQERKDCKEFAEILTQARDYSIELEEDNERFLGYITLCIEFTSVLRVT